MKNIHESMHITNRIMQAIKPSINNTNSPKQSINPLILTTILSHKSFIQFRLRSNPFMQSFKLSIYASLSPAKYIPDIQAINMLT